MFPSILRRERPLIHLSCVLGTPPRWSAFACVCLVEKQHLFRSGLFNRVLKVLDAVLQGCRHFESITQTQTTAIDFLWIAKTKRNNSNKKSCLLNNSLFQSVDTTLTKYGTLRIVHIVPAQDRLKREARPVDRVFPRKSETALATYPVKPWRITLLDVYSPNFTGGSLHANCPKCLGFRKLYRGVGRRWRRNRSVDWIRSARGCTQLGWWMRTQPPKGTHAKSSDFLTHSSYRPSIPSILCINYGLPMPPFGFPLFHYIRLPLLWQIKKSPVLKRASASPMFSSAPSSIPRVRYLTEMVSCFLPAAVLAWHGHIMKSSRLPTSENPIFSISSWRCMTDRVSPSRSKGRLLWTLWRKIK